MKNLFNLIKESKNNIIHTIELTDNIVINDQIISGKFCLYTQANEFVAEYAINYGDHKLFDLIDSNCENFDELKVLVIEEIVNKVKEI